MKEDNVYDVAVVGGVFAASGRNTGHVALQDIHGAARRPIGCVAHSTRNEIKQARDELSNSPPLKNCYDLPAMRKKFATSFSNVASNSLCKSSFSLAISFLL